MSMSLAEQVNLQSDIVGKYTRDAAERIAYLMNKTFDYAIPQQWADDVYKRTSIYPRDIVWLYEDKSIWGKPYALSAEGAQLITVYKHLVALDK